MYYELNMHWDPKVLGVKNGVYQVELDKSKYDKRIFEELHSNFIGNAFSAKQVIPEIDFKFYFKKLRSAKKTGFMSFCPNLNHSYFLVHRQVLELFDDLKIQSYKTYEAVIYDEKTDSYDSDYKLFYTVLQDWDVIDFTNTVFVSGGLGSRPLLEYKFSDEIEKRSFDAITRVKTLAFTESFDRTLDFFITRVGGKLVSERFKQSVEKNGITGVYFTNNVEVLI